MNASFVEGEEEAAWAVPLATDNPQSERNALQQDEALWRALIAVIRALWRSLFLQRGCNGRRVKVFP